MIANFDNYYSKSTGGAIEDKKQETTGENIQEEFTIDDNNRDLVKSNESLKILNEFMELLILLDQLYTAPEQQQKFFDSFKDPFLFVLAKSYDF